MRTLNSLFLLPLINSLLFAQLNPVKPDTRSLFSRQKVLAQKDNDNAKAIVAGAINLMGGETALRQMNYISYEGIGHTFISSIAVRPQGPQPVQYDSVKQVMSLKDQSLHRSVGTRLSFRANEFNSTLIVSAGAAAVESGGKVNPAPAFQFYKAQDEFLINPVLAVLAALDSPDLKDTGQVMLGGAPQQTVSFQRNGIPLKIFINPHTGLPSAVEITRSYPADIFSDMWGDITTRTTFSTWSYEAGGIRYPRQWTVEVNNELTTQFSITALKLNETPSPEAFTISSETRASFEKSLALKPLDLARQNFTGASLTISPGIIMLPGVERKYNSTIIQQQDGLLILETPYSADNSSLVIAEAERLFPGQRIKAVITTSQIWIHVGGIRAYIARGIPVYALDSNAALVARLARAPHTLTPDALQRQPRRAIIKAVSSPMNIGDGENQIVLYPFRSEGGERMMAVYFPQKQLLYGSDLYNPKAFSQQLWTEHVLEVEGLIKREQLNVRTVFGIHLPPGAWSDVTNELDGLRAGTNAH